MQIGLAPLMVALAAPWSEEKSHGTDDATVAGSRHRTVGNLSTFWTSAVVRMDMQRQWSREN
jgi:hypothetical protein